MTTERRNLGDILQEIGRVTQDDVDRALGHQAAHGGFFGEALVALGIVSQQEVDWTLASQFDLPYVYPHAESVDPEAALLVRADWALRHMALPLTRTGDRLTLVVDSPLNTMPAEELSRRTGFDVDLALASTHTIREAIRGVYSRWARSREGLASGEALSFEALVEGAMKASSERWGVSVREERAIGWWESGERRHRYRMQAGWEDALNEILVPPPVERLPRHGEVAWVATIQTVRSAPTLIEVRALVTGEGREILFTPKAPSESERLLPTVPQDLLDELRLLVEQTRIVLALTGQPSGTVRDLLPHLPGLLLPTGYRSLHLTGNWDTGDTPGVLTLPLETPDGSGERRLEELGDFRFDALTVDLTPDQTRFWGGLRELAVDVFVYVGTPDELSAALLPSGVNWLLDLRDRGGGAWSWTLEPVEG